MMKPNMFKSLTTSSTIFLIFLTTSSMAFSMDPSPYTHMTEMQSRKMAARDAITLSIREVRETRKFVDMIPRLKSVQVTNLDPQLLLCVENLIFDLSNIKSILYRLRHLKQPYLMTDTNSLKRMMNDSMKVGKMCGGSFKNVDEIALSMLTRKLDDLSMVIDNVVYHVTEFDQDVYRVVETGKEMHH